MKAHTRPFLPSLPPSVTNHTVLSASSVQVTVLTLGVQDERETPCSEEAPVWWC